MIYFTLQKKGLFCTGNLFKSDNFKTAQKAKMTEKWARLGDMGTSYRARHGLRAVALKNSMILIYGGGNAGIINELHLYNPVNNQYNIPKVKGQVPSGTAAFGMATDGLKVYIFGGMAEYRVYTNDLFQLDTTNWLWSKIDQRGEVPTPRLGHSFTFVDDNRIFLFGGLEKISSSSGNNIPHYLNDLFVLHILNDHYEWEHVTTSGRRRPSERESHTANLYFKQSENKKYLVIFGGMNGERLGDLWMLDTETLSWSCLEVTGLLPTPRSLHSANLVGKKMYIFGGWITCAMAKKRNELKNWGWKCTDTLYCLDLEKMTWKSIQTSCPAARAGHCTAEYDGRIFLWHGRNGVRTASESAIKPDCYNDAWYLETKTPKKILLLNLLHASYKFLDICWAKCSTADCYLLELRKVDQPKNLKIIDKCYNEEPKSQTSRTPEKPTPKNRVTKRPILKLNVPHKKLLTAIHSNVMLKSENTITATSNKVSTASVVVHGNRRFIPGQVVSLNLSAVRKFPAPSQMRQIMGMKSVSIKPSISFQSLPQMGIVTDENVSKLSTEGVEELDDVSKEVDKMNNNRHEDINVDSTVRSCAIDKRSISEERLAEDCIEEANDSTESETESHEVVVLEEKIIKPLVSENCQNTALQ